MILKIFTLCITLLSAASFGTDSLRTASNFKMLFRANGLVTLGVHPYGEPKFGELGPGYRSDLAVNTEMVSYKELTFDFLTAASTSIARLPETPVKLDKIIYTLTPQLRYSFRKSLATVSLYHQCIHTLSREEKPGGSTWWNVLQGGFGTKGAYSFHLIQKYNNRDFSLRNSFDVNLNAGYYFRGDAALIGNNHNYKYDVSGLVRYHLGLFRNQTIFFDINHHFWYSMDDKVTAKISGEVNYVILAFDNIATLYYNHCFVDDNPYDNEHSLGTLGFKVIF
ncbi:MAG: hypothetical protein JNL74_04660 [Fibrobacteres bacterium]|nr:hypothetical protein [Fibrobacterota bacterium]